MRAALVIAGLTVRAAFGASQSPQPVFRSEIDVVRVDVSVMNGVVPVPGLTAANFELSDNGVTQAIDDVSVDAVPLDITLALDTSASLRGEPLAQLIEAARGLAQTLEPRDQTALMTFSEPVRLTAERSRDRRPLLEALASLKAEGYTSLNDALFVALQLHPRESTAARSVLLVFSDGEDTSSWLSSAQVLEAMRRSGTVAHVVELIHEGATGTLRDKAPPGPSRFLRELALAGGGRTWSATSSRDLRKLFAEVITEIRARYLLTYSPRGVPRDGWHGVKVTLKKARGTVIARPGYFVPPLL